MSLMTEMAPPSLLIIRVSHRPTWPPPLLFPPPGLEIASIIPNPRPPGVRRDPTLEKRGGGRGEEEQGGGGGGGGGRLIWES